MKRGTWIRRILIALLSITLIVQCIAIISSDGGKHSYLTYAEEPTDPEAAVQPESNAEQRSGDTAVQEAAPVSRPVPEPAPAEQRAEEQRVQPQEQPKEETKEQPKAEPKEETKAEPKESESADADKGSDKRDDAGGADDEKAVPPDTDGYEDPEEEKADGDAADAVDAVTDGEKTEQKTAAEPAPQADAGDKATAEKTKSEGKSEEQSNPDAEAGKTAFVDETEDKPIEADPQTADETKDVDTSESDQADGGGTVSEPLTVKLNTNRNYAFKDRDAVTCSVEVNNMDTVRKVTLTASTAAGEKAIGEQQLAADAKEAVFEYIPDTPGEQVLRVHAETAPAGGDGEENRKTADAAVSLAVPEYITENAWMWQQEIKALNLTGDWRHDLLTVAESQIGQQESEKNYILVDGQKKGSTRYGVWAGDEYGDWCAAFVSFCLANAQVPKDGVPRATGCSSLMNRVGKAGGLEDKDYKPSPGDLVFLRKKDSPNNADHIGIVKSGTGGSLVTVEGNTSSDRVQTVSRDLNDADAPSHVVGYANVSKLEQKYAAAHGGDEKPSEGAVSESAEGPKTRIMETSIIDEDEESGADKGENKRETRFVDDEPSEEGSVLVTEEEIEDGVTADAGRDTAEKAQGKQDEEIAEKVILDDDDQDIAIEDLIEEQPEERKEEQPEENNEEQPEEKPEEEQPEEGSEEVQPEEEQLEQRTLVSEAKDGMPRVEVSGMLPEGVSLQVTALTGMDGLVASPYNVLNAMEIKIVDASGEEYRNRFPLTAQIFVGETDENASGGPIGLWQAPGQTGTGKAVRISRENREDGRIVFTIKPAVQPDTQPAGEQQDTQPAEEQQDTQPAEERQDMQPPEAQPDEKKEDEPPEAADDPAEQ